MAEIRFDELVFRKGKGSVRAVFQGMYFFDLENQELQDIGEFEVKEGALVFAGLADKKAQNKVNLLMNRGFLRLRSIMTGKRTVYVHRDSSIPLIGSKYFGIIDRNTTIVELRPATGCNLGCVYCSIDEGRGSRSLIDYYVEKDYLVQELQRLLGEKQCESVEVYINPYGEPLLYRPLAPLIRDISAIPSVAKISVNTNGTMLTRALIDDLRDAGLSLLIVSLNSMDKELAERIAGCPYDVSHVLDMISYAKERLDVQIAPVYLPGENDSEIERIIRHFKAKDIKVFIQNYLVYKHGRKPVKPMGMDDFYEKLEEWEQKTGMKLRVRAGDLGVSAAKPLANPFRKGETVPAEIVCPGRHRGEMLASARGRTIQVSGCRKSSGRVKVSITRTKHNIISGIYKN